MAQLTANASASLTANGTSTATGSISWTPPTLPPDAVINSIAISGSWTWGGKGSITYVTINGTNTSDGIAFDITLPNNVTSPLSISCVGNKNATGNSFTWGNLIVTYTYTVPSSETLYEKANGTWGTLSKVYKKINGTWVEQTDIASLFDNNDLFIKQ